MALCAAGTYASADHSSCPFCPAGRFSVVGAVSVDNCTACGQGYYCDGAGLRAPCPAGRFSSSSTASSASVGPSACAACGVATMYCPLGASAPLLPDPGYYPVSTVGSGGNVAQRACPLGARCVGGTKQLCSPGTFANASASAACTLCAPGRYADTSGASDCLPCRDMEGSYEGAVRCWPGLVAAVAFDGGRGPDPLYPVVGLGRGDVIAVELSSPCNAAGVVTGLPVVFERMTSPGAEGTPPTYAAVSFGAMSARWATGSQQLLLNVTSVGTASPEADLQETIFVRLAVGKKEGPRGGVV